MVRHKAKLGAQVKTGWIRPMRPRVPSMALTGVAPSCSTGSPGWNPFPALLRQRRPRVYQGVARQEVMMGAKLVLAVTLATKVTISPAAGQDASRPIASERGMKYELWDTNELFVVLGKSVVLPLPLDPSMYGRRVAFAGLTRANACPSVRVCTGMQIWLGRVGSLYGYFRPGDEAAQYRQMTSKCPLGAYNYCATLVYAELVSRAGAEGPQIEVISTKYSSYRYSWAPGTVTTFSVAPEDVIRSFNLRVDRH